MTLKLVSTDNVVDIGVYNPMLIPSIARTFADKVEEGEFGEVTRAVVILETDEGLIKFFWGEAPTHLEAVGILQLALHDATVNAIDSYGDDAE